MRDDERALLDHLLQVDMPGIAELRTQLEWTKVVEDPSWPGDVILSVPDDAPPAKRVLDNHPIRCLGKDWNLDIGLEMDGFYLGCVSSSGTTASLRDYRAPKTSSRHHTADGLGCSAFVGS